MHYVKLDDSPKVWADLASYNVTAREACGNTVRNITASAKAGIDPNELFDVSPYAHGSFEYFLRNPICQDMGRKIKPAFSSSDNDSAFTYFHDFGFIPRIQKNEAGEERRGFKVIVAGGLGAVSMIGHTVYEFLPEEQIIPFMEAGIRVFDRYGEREKRMKARMKFLVKKIGIEEFMRLLEEERKGLASQEYWIDRDTVDNGAKTVSEEILETQPHNAERFETWKRTNVFEQKQKGWFAVQVRVYLGNISAEKARKFAALVSHYAADDIRITVNQGMLLRFIRSENLAHVFNELDKLGLAEPGFDSIFDITACPGTDTCALGVTNSTGLSGELEKVLQREYPELVDERNIKIKISGCMNSCGQHMAANIGFHGSSITKKALVVPAMQVVIGGGVSPEGEGFVAQKVSKVPTKKVPDVVRYLLDDYSEHAEENEYFNNYFYRKGKPYFYKLLKPLTGTDELEGTDFFDWGQDYAFKPQVGVGECAGVTLDVVGTIIQDAYDKVELAKEAMAAKAYGDSIYHSYTAFVVGAKAMLLSADV
ncbi:MAG: nitrite/sulfite reductase, partial [Bacteroidota bacterium]